MPCCKWAVRRHGAVQAALNPRGGKRWLRVSAVICGGAAVGAGLALLVLSGHAAPRGGQVIAAGRTGTFGAEAIERDMIDDWRG